MTPPAFACHVLQGVHVSQSTRVLEPSFGDGSFILPLIERFLALYDGPIEERLTQVLNCNVFGVEIDPVAYKACLDKIGETWGYVPPSHNLLCTDFLALDFRFWEVGARPQVLFGVQTAFDLIVGNPPFGGTIDLKLQNQLDKRYGFRNGDKIKKETYAFFIVKCLDHLQIGGRLLFICSDTLMTIRTMRGLRRLLMEECNVTVRRLASFSRETSYPMVLLDATKSGRSDAVTVDNRRVSRCAMDLTGNFSWTATDDFAEYFSGPTLGDYVVCTSGMTIGKNDLFLRRIAAGEIVEPYEFEFFEDPITVARELEKARLHTLSPKVLQRIQDYEKAGLTRRNVRAVEREVPTRIRLPHPDYRYYNKATSRIIYSEPTHAIFWRDHGDAVLTYKKNGNWYLHGVGGRRYFGRSGLTWQLISTRLNVRFLPAGYILDSGAPCAFLRQGVDEEELFFLLGWTCTDLCTLLLKTVVNHTKNIQSKDFERLPYPYWVEPGEKAHIIKIVRSLVRRAMGGEQVDRRNSELTTLEDLFSHTEQKHKCRVESKGQLRLWS